MTWLNGLSEIVERDKPLGPLTWFRIGGPAKYFFTPRSVEELRTVVRRCREQDVPLYVLGRGANVLVGDEGVVGAVVRLDSDAFKEVRIEDERVVAGGGADLARLIIRTVHDGLSGMECLAGIPSSVGGAVKMNAGGRFGDVGGICESVSLMDEDGVVTQKQREDMVFGYRETNIGSAIILEGTFRLSSDDPDRVLREFREIWMYKRNSQPLASKSAGCVFKNPRQLSAGVLIDRAGLKGLTEGRAEVSQKHANFIVTHEGCTSRDVRKLIRRVRETVEERFGVQLELEVQVW
jgi:UDP-N-acetylmuramate dehydrogenase